MQSFHLRADLDAVAAAVTEHLGAEGFTATDNHDADDPAVRRVALYAERGWVGLAEDPFATATWGPVLSEALGAEVVTLAGERDHAFYTHVFVHAGGVEKHAARVRGAGRPAPALPRRGRAVAPAVLRVHERRAAEGLRARGAGRGLQDRARARHARVDGGAREEDGRPAAPRVVRLAGAGRRVRRAERPRGDLVPPRRRRVREGPHGEPLRRRAGALRGGASLRAGGGSRVDRARRQAGGARHVHAPRRRARPAAGAPGHVASADRGASAPGHEAARSALHRIESGRGHDVDRRSLRRRGRGRARDHGAIERPRDQRRHDRARDEREAADARPDPAGGRERSASVVRRELRRAGALDAAANVSLLLGEVLSGASIDVVHQPDGPNHAPDLAWPKDAARPPRVWLAWWCPRPDSEAMERLIAPRMA